MHPTGEVDVTHHGTLFHPGPFPTGGTCNDVDHLLDHQLDVGSTASVVQDPDIFETHQGLENLARVAEDEGASCLLAHTSSLKHLRSILGDTEAASSPLKSEEPLFLERTTGFEPATLTLAR